MSSRLRRFLVLTAMLALVLAVSGVALSGVAEDPTNTKVAGIDVDATTIPELQELMNSRKLSSVELTNFYVKRIHQLSKELHAVITVSPTARKDAQGADQARRNGDQRPLLGIPIIVKDNVNTTGMPTTAGSFALAKSTPTDAFIAARLKAAGAIIIGKANLSEWANFRSGPSSSGWSGVEGQTSMPYVLDRNPCGSSSGSGVVFAALPSYRPDEQARAHVFCHAVPGGWHAMGVMLSAAGSLQWLRDTVAPGVSFDALVAEAARWEPGVEGLVFLPYLQGERTPHADPDARGSFTGLQLRHDRGALVRAVLEGVAFGLRDSLDVVRGLGIEVTSARVSGGGARSDLWLAICASVLGVPIERTVVEEGSAFGAALLGGVAGGVFADVHDAVAATVRTHAVIEPDPAWHDVYTELQLRYRALYPVLRDLEGVTVER